MDSTDQPNPITAIMDSTDQLINPTDQPNPVTVPNPNESINNKNLKNINMNKSIYEMWNYLLCIIHHH